MVICVNVRNPHVRKGIIQRYELLPGVSIASSIVKVNNESKALTTVPNSTENQIKFESIIVTLELLDNFSNKLKVSMGHLTSQSAVDRVNKLESLLRLDQLNNEEREPILNLCKEYNTIFT